jgi:AraC-like DNA-binding protein
LEETDSAPPTLRERRVCDQNRHMTTAAVLHNRLAPRASTTPVVAALFVVECELDMPLVSIPRPEPQVVVRFGASARNSLDVHALGAGAKVHRKVGRRGQRAVVLRLHLGAPESVLGTPASTIADRIVPLEELWGAAARRLVDRLFSARDMIEAAAILETAIADRFAAARVRGERAQFVLNAAERLSGANVSAVAADLGVSERHFRRVFRESVGVSPKAFTRLTRFHRALRAAREDGRESWASIAAGAGYYDQAHLIAEFRAIAGAPPRAFLDELRAASSLD